MSEAKQNLPLGVPREEKSSFYKELYANFVRAGLTPWDITLVFGQLQEHAPGETMSVTTDVGVKISPHQFKVFASTLPLILRQWEERFGEISISSEFVLDEQKMHAHMDAHNAAFRSASEKTSKNKKSS